MNNKHINFEVTAKCNQKCIYCFNAYRRENLHNLSMDEIAAILKNLENKQVRSILFTGGEPFSRKDIIDILNLSLEMQFNTSVLSNGLKIASLLKKHLSTFQRLDTIQISLDTFDSEKLAQIRGYKRALQDATSALNALIEYGIKNIEVSSVFNPQNTNDILDVAKFVYGNKIKLIVREPYSEIDKSELVAYSSYEALLGQIESLYPGILIKDKFSYVTDENLTINSQGKFIKMVA